MARFWGRGELLNVKCAWFPLHLFFSWNNSHPMKNSVGYYHANYPLFLSDFNQTWIFSTDFWHTLKYITALQVGRSQVQFPMASLKFFIDIILPAPTATLGLTQPLTEMSTRNTSLGGKGVRCTGLTTLPLSCADCLDIWEPQPPGTLWACPGL